MSSSISTPQPSPTISTAQHIKPTERSKAKRSRASLYLKAWIFRSFQTLGRWCDIYLSTPLPMSPALKIRIPSIVGDVKGNLELYFYAPMGWKEGLGKSKEKYPLLVNFHGGGYTIGHAADDGRFCTSIISRTKCVVVSVNYRLAPRHPFPIAIGDCVSAIIYLWSHSSSLNLDASRTAISGFSAGGNFCFTSCYLLHYEIAARRAENRIKEEDIGRIISLAAYYPAVDWTKSRMERDATNPNVKPIVNSFLKLFLAFEDSYLYPLPEMHSPLISPGLASDELIKEALPQKIIIMTCWFDGLLVEGEKFRKRLQELGKRVDGEIIQGVQHGWDKWPTASSSYITFSFNKILCCDWFHGDARRDAAYKSTAESLKEFWS